MKWQWLVVGGLIALTLISPLLGIIGLSIFIHWQFREFFWRLRMAKLIFIGVLLLGIYLSSFLGGILSFFLK